MRLPLLLLLTIVMLSLHATGTAVAERIEWKVADGGNGHYYEQIRDEVRRNWVDAAAIAALQDHLGIQGHLVTITSSAENDFLYAQIFDGGINWIGLTDDPAFGGTESFSLPNRLVDGWVWVSGEPVNYVHWQGVEPNNQAGDENYAHTSGNNSGWNDLSIGNHIDGYVVEFSVVPEPGSLALCITGLLSLVACAARCRRPQPSQSLGTSLPEKRQHRDR